MRYHDDLGPHRIRVRRVACPWWRAAWLDGLFGILAVVGSIWLWWAVFTALAARP